MWVGGGALAVAALVTGMAWIFGPRDPGRTAAPSSFVQQEVSKGEPSAPQPPAQAADTAAAESLVDQLLRLRSSDGAVVVSLEPPVGGARPRLALGTPLHFRVESERRGHLLLFALSSDGSIACLYPNPQRPEVTVDRGTTLVLPRAADKIALFAQEPLGRELVFALIDERELPSLPAGGSAESDPGNYLPGEPAQAFTAWLERLRRENREETRMAVVDFEIGTAR
jgi:hypothetical protein